MTEEPYRWLEAIANRREYVHEQLRGGLPGFGISFPAGILLAAPGDAKTKVFEIHDRLAMVALGHPSDIERVRQIAIDAAHIEAFTRSSQDVNLRRLISANLAPLVKQSFEQIFSPPYLVEVLFAELGPRPEDDAFIRLRPDGSFATHKGAAVVWTDPAAETETAQKLEVGRSQPADVWAALKWIEEVAIAMIAAKGTGPKVSNESEGQLRKTFDVGLLERRSWDAVSFRPLAGDQLGFALR
jgi:proteasome alpha subunit